MSITVFNILPHSNCFYWTFLLWKPFFHCKHSGSSQWALAPSGEKYYALVNKTISENLFMPFIPEFAGVLCWSGAWPCRERVAAWVLAVRETPFSPWTLPAGPYQPFSLTACRARALRAHRLVQKWPQTMRACHLNMGEILPCSSQVTSGHLCHQSYWNEPPAAPHLDFDKVCTYSWILLLELTFSFQINFCWLPSKTKENLHYLGNVMRMTLQKPEFNLKKNNSIWAICKGIPVKSMLLKLT